MSQHATKSSRQSRLLLLAFSAHPRGTMEARVGWHRALQAARHYETWLLYGDRHERAELAALAREAGVNANLKFIRVPAGRVSGTLLNSAQLFWQGYALWQHRAFQLAGRLHRKHRFDLIHQVSFCGYREPGYTWQLDAPFVIGPVGGTHNFPLRYLSQIDAWGGLREVARNGLNFWHLRFRRRVVAAFRHADAVLTANATARRDLARILGVESLVQLETGVHDQLRGQPRQRPAAAPLRILWAGRFRSWKAFPILLRALARVPSDVRFELRVLGEGPCERRWKEMARQLNIAHRVQWVGWPAYDQTLPHYHWADIFSFTSLRDTSGTGLLESLAAGVPIVGVNHQGAADIMTEDCAWPIRVGDPEQTIAEFTEAITCLSRKPERLRQLHEGALRRAEYFRWSRQGERMNSVYQAVLLGQAPVDPQDWEDAQDNCLSSPSAVRAEKDAAKSPSGRLAAMVSK
jgi:glycosyltransferase involved in cell wall biosynthesis